jgi:ankyrin repeat protein
MRQLLRAGADFNIEFGSGMFTPLMCSPSPALTKLLLLHGANASFIGNNGGTTVSSLAFHAPSECVELLIHKGAGPSPVAFAQHHPLNEASYSARADSCTLDFLLWAGSDPNVTFSGDQGSTTVLCEVSNNTPIEHVKTFLCYGGGQDAAQQLWIPPYPVRSGPRGFHGGVTLVIPARRIHDVRQH